METGTRLALEAIVLGLRRSGALHEHAMIVIIDELRMAAQQARESLHDHAGTEIERLAATLQLEVRPLGRANASTPGPRMLHVPNGYR